MTTREEVDAILAVERWATARNMWACGPMPYQRHGMRGDAFLCMRHRPGFLIIQEDSPARSVSGPQALAWAVAYELISHEAAALVIEGCPVMCDPCGGDGCALCDDTGEVCRANDVRRAYGVAAATIAEGIALLDASCESRADAVR